MLDQALDPAEALRQAEDLASGKHAPGRLQATFDDGGDHPAEAVHLTARELVLRMAGQAGVDHAIDPRVLLEPPGDGQRVAAVAFHPQAQSLDAPMREVAVERAGDGADGILEEPEPLAKLGVGADD